MPSGGPASSDEHIERVQETFSEVGILLQKRAIFRKVSVDEADKQLGPLRLELVAPFLAGLKRTAGTGEHADWVDYDHGFEGLEQVVGDPREHNATQSVEQRA